VPRPPRAGTETRPTISHSKPEGRSTTGFDRFSFRPEIRRGIAGAGFREPRPVQELAIPPALEGRDVLGLAQTGTGKTAAFVLPILEHLLATPRKGVRALIVAPTRELASQIQAETELLAKETPLKCTSIFGGVPAARQIRELRRDPSIVIACPGRLLDLHQQRVLRLDAVEVLVLDEADHMFDMGFLPSIRRILAALPKRRQNLLFSATMPKEVRGLADAILQKPEVVDLASSVPAATIAHALYPVSEGHKITLLEHLIAGADFRTAIVFLRTKRRAKRLAERLSKGGHNAVALQGNMSQAQRERAMQGFRDGTFDILVATDIAARGIDVAGISHVINFDVPNTPDAYTHRIGRTGRAELRGTAFTFVTPDDAESVRAIEKRIGAKIERRALGDIAGASTPERSLLAKSGAEPREGRGGGRGAATAARGRNARPSSKVPSSKASARTVVRARLPQRAPVPAPAPAPADARPFGSGVATAETGTRAPRPAASPAPARSRTAPAPQSGSEKSERERSSAAPGKRRRGRRGGRRAS